PGAYLRPLLEAALEESLRRGAKALTGPVVRGDAGTITAHLEALDDLDATGEQGRTGDTATTYRALARAALSTAGLPPDTQRRIRALLDGPTQAEGGRAGPARWPGRSGRCAATARQWRGRWPW